MVSDHAQRTWISESHENIRNGRMVGGLKEFCRKHPDRFLALWVCGALKDPMSELVKRPGGKTGFDLLMLEVYFNYKIPEMRDLHPFRYLQEGIDSAHRQDILPQCVFTIGIHGNYDKYDILPEELETVVRLRLVERTKWEKMERAYQKRTGTWMSSQALRRCYREAMELMTEEPEERETLLGDLCA